jgi:general secretion pathway protein A
LAQLPEIVDTVLIFNPHLNAVELLATICDEFRIDYPAEMTSLKSLVDALTDYLLASIRRSL